MAVLRNRKPVYRTGFYRNPFFLVRAGKDGSTERNPWWRATILYTLYFIIHTAAQQRTF